MNSRCGVDHDRLWSLVDSRSGVDRELAAHVEICPDCSERVGELRRLCSGLESLGRELRHPMPERIGSYRIVRVIGEGGMGVVYEARQETPDRSVALKVVCPGAHSDVRRLRFRREIETLGRLCHPGIARIYDAGVTADGQPWFVMELVAGRAIDRYCDEQRLETRRRVELVLAVLDAVDHAHRRGVIHRDLKPANVLVDEHGSPRVLDFGLARMIGDDGEQSLSGSRGAALIGTLPFMSPEQVAGPSKALDVRADVYALGVMLYRLVSGRHPYDLGADVASAIAAITTSAPQPWPEGDHVLEGIVRTALAKDRGERHPSAAALALDLRRYLAGQAIAAHRANPRPRRVLRGVAALAGVLAVAVATVTLGDNRDTKATASAAAGSDGAADASPGVESRQVQMAWDSCGSLSPDGRRVSLVDWDTGNVAVRDLDGGPPRNVTEDAHWEAPFCWSEFSIWSPAGDRLAYNWVTASHHELRTIDLQGGAPHTVWSGAAYPYPRAWSPDGAALIVEFGDQGKWTLGRVSLDGTVAMLGSWGGGRRPGLGLGLSPDGRWLSFVHQVDAGEARFAIHVIDVGSGLERPLTDVAVDDSTDTCWTPDGRWLVYTGHDAHVRAIRALRVERGCSVGVARELWGVVEGARIAGFARDGSLFLSVSRPGADVFTVGLDPETGELDESPALVDPQYPDRSRLAAWSPDGASLSWFSRRGSGDRGTPWALIVRESSQERVFELPAGFRPGFGAPRRSHDGQMFALTSHPGGPDRGLFVVDAGSGTARKLASGGYMSAVWSRTDREILALRNDRHVPELIRCDLASGSAVVLCRLTGTPRHLALSPAGDEVLYWAADGVRAIGVSCGSTRLVMPRAAVPATQPALLKELAIAGDQVYFCRLRSGRPTELYSTPIADGEPVTLVGLLPQRLDGLDLRPDGRAFAFTIERSHHEFRKLVAFADHIAALSLR